MRLLAEILVNASLPNADIRKVLQRLTIMNPEGLSAPCCQSQTLRRSHLISSWNILSSTTEVVPFVREVVP
jgi:hypothetical protein